MAFIERCPRVRGGLYEGFHFFFSPILCSPSLLDNKMTILCYRLKDNLQRLCESTSHHMTLSRDLVIVYAARTSRPWQDFGHFLQGILQWKSIAESLVVFLVSIGTSSPHSLTP